MLCAGGDYDFWTPLDTYTPARGGAGGDVARIGGTFTAPPPREQTRAPTTAFISLAREHAPAVGTHSHLHTSSGTGGPRTAQLTAQWEAEEAPSPARAPRASDNTASLPVHGYHTDVLGPSAHSGRNTTAVHARSGGGSSISGGGGSGDPGSVGSIAPWYAAASSTAYAMPSCGGSRGGSRSVDLGVVFDGTESMKPYWVQCKAKILEIVDTVKAALPEGSDVHVGVVNYRDVGVTPPVLIKAFSADIEDVKLFIASQVRKRTLLTNVQLMQLINSATAGLPLPEICASHSPLQDTNSRGNTDFPEDVAGGLRALQSLDWRKGAVRLVVHIGDAPGHGTNYHDGQYHDSRAGNLHEDKLEPLVVWLAEFPINYYFVRIGKHTDKMVDKLQAAYNAVGARKRNVEVLTLGDASVGDLLAAFTQAVTTSVRSFGGIS